MYIYFLKEEMLRHFETGDYYISYGIGVYTVHNNRKYRAKYIGDVFLQRRQAERLVKMCNQNQLHPLHLENVIEDMLCRGVL